MADFQTVKRRGHSQNANSKYPEQHQQLVEMGFDAVSVSKALDASSGDMESATAALIGEASNKAADSEEKVVNVMKEKKPVATHPVSTSAASAAAATASAATAKAARQSSGLATVSGPAVKEIKDTHQRMMATYKVQKCKESGAHDRKMCMHYHSLSDRRRNPFEILYSCYECPNTVDGGECPDGDSCMHSHTMLERMFHPELYKISVCQRQLTGNKCDRAMLCAFAHNDADLRISPSHLTTKYAMQEEAKAVPFPVNQSQMIDHIRNNLVRLIKEHGSEGVIAAELPKFYQGRFHESLDLIDETGKKYKLKDLIGPHNNIHVVLTGQPKFVFGDPNAPSTDSSSPTGTVSSNPAVSSVSKDSASQNSLGGPVTPQVIKDRVVELIKSAGTDGILATDMMKKYQERFGEKLDKDWNVGLNGVAGMVLTQTKQYTKYTFNAITAGIKDAALPALGNKDSKTSSVPVAASSSKGSTVGAAQPAASTTTATTGGSKWGSSAGKSFASILANNTSTAAPAIGNVTTEPVVSEAAKQPSTPSNSVSEFPPVSSVSDSKTAPAVVASKVTKPSTDKNLPKSNVSTKSDNRSNETTAVTANSTTAESDIVPDATPSASTTAATSDSILGSSISPNPSSPRNSLGVTLGSSPSSSRSTSDMLPKPLFGNLDGQLGVTGLDHEQFSIPGVTGLGGNGSSSLLDLTGGSLADLLQSSFDLSLVDNMDLSSSNVLPPGLSKTIGKPSGVSTPSLTSILGSTLGSSVSNSALVGMPLASSSRETPERNASNGASVIASVVNSNMTQSERIAALERELASRVNDSEVQVMETAALKARISELESSQHSFDDRLRSSIMEKDIELLAKHQELSKLEDETRKMKEEKLVDLDQYFIYFSKIEEVINSMKCKEEAFSDKVKTEDVQELFQFKKLIRNYVANVKVQLKNKFDVAVAQTHLMRSTSGNTIVKEPSVEAVALGMALSSGPPPGNLGSSASIGAAAAGNATTPSSVNSVFGVLSSGASASSVSSTSRFASTFDNHSVLSHHLSHNHHGLGNVVDAFASSSVLFPSSSSDLAVSSTAAASLSSNKQCGLPGCFKEGLYTCAGCRKISYCGEAHQRSHWGQHSQTCYQR